MPIQSNWHEPPFVPEFRLDEKSPGIAAGNTGNKGRFQDFATD